MPPAYFVLIKQVNRSDLVGMYQLRIESLESIPCGMVQLLGNEFYVQRFYVGSIAYRILFIPLESEATSTRKRIEDELGPLPDNLFEVKFVLGLDFDNPNGFEFLSPRQLDLDPLNRQGLAKLGEALVDCIMQFGEKVACEGFIAMALEERRGLNSYYQRLLKTHEARITSSGYESKCCLGGQGYALLRN